jgi:hypothetical protein
MPSFRKNDRRPQAPLLLLALGLLTAGLAPVSAADLFADHCQARLSDIQQDRRLCVVGIMQDERHLQIIAATRPDFAGRVVSVYESHVVQNMRVPLAGLAGNKGRIVAVGGFVDGDNLFSARRL